MKPDQQPGFWNEYVPHDANDPFGLLLQRPAYQITAEEVAMIYMREDRKRRKHKNTD